MPHGADVIAAIVALCEARPAEESCGLVIERDGARRVLEIPNAADRFHAANPFLHPRTARDGYVMDPGALVRVFRQVDQDGGRVVAVWHSHVDGSASFSAQDRADAFVEGAPVLPGVEYVVVGMRAGRATEVRAWRFDGADWVDTAGAPT